MLPAERPLAAADGLPDVAAAERALTAAETLGATSAETARRRAQALTEAETVVSSAARTASDATTASEAATNSSKEAAVASEDFARSASRAQASISRARKALRAARADSSTKPRRVAETRHSGERLPLAETATTPLQPPVLTPPPRSLLAPSRSTPGSSVPGI